MVMAALSYDAGHSLAPRINPWHRREERSGRATPWSEGDTTVRGRCGLNGILLRADIGDTHGGKDGGDDTVTRRAGRSNKMWVWALYHMVILIEWTGFFRWESKECLLVFLMKNDSLLWEKCHLHFYILKNVTYHSKWFPENSYQQLMYKWAI